MPAVGNIGTGDPAHGIRQAVFKDDTVCQLALQFDRFFRSQVPGMQIGDIHRDQFQALSSKFDVIFLFQADSI